MDRLFLDANVLFSAAYREDAGLQALWERPDAALVTSGYALEEARRNLTSEEQAARLSQLIDEIEVVPEAPELPLPTGVDLPEKDRPILRAAVAAEATHLVTGDRTHFGPYWGETVSGLTVIRPAAALGD